MNHRYSIQIHWSDPDRLYLVTIPEFAELVMQPCTSGQTYREAIDNAEDCIEACLEFWHEGGIIPPLPRVLQVAQNEFIGHAPIASSES
jgi:predicted RNase H-like HicB family nuclease